jgi:hypothetical protein
VIAVLAEGDDAPRAIGGLPLAGPGTVSERSLGWPHCGQFPGIVVPHEAIGLDASAFSRKSPVIANATMPRRNSTGPPNHPSSRSGPGKIMLITRGPKISTPPTAPKAMATPSEAPMDLPDRCSPRSARAVWIRTSSSDGWVVMPVPPPCAMLLLLSMSPNTVA